MATITAADVNKLRTITGAGMMDCKKALVESDGDFDLAIENLRKKGQKVAANRSDRESTEGAAIAVVNDAKTSGVVITLNFRKNGYRNGSFSTKIQHKRRIISCRF
jgi:elongation factor Ts